MRVVYPGASKTKGRFINRHCVCTFRITNGLPTSDPKCKVEFNTCASCEAIDAARIADLECLTDEELRAEFAKDGLDLVVEADRALDLMLATVRAWQDAQAFVGAL